MNSDHITAAVGHGTIEERSLNIQASKRKLASQEE